MFSSRRASVLFTLFLLSLTACTKQASGPPPRYAFLRFENLSGNPALDWTARATSEVLARSLASAMDGPVIATAALLRLQPALGPRPLNVPGISAERQEALAAGATRFVTGYVQQSGSQVRIAATVEDAGTAKTLRFFSASAADPMRAMLDLSRQFSSAAKPYLTSNPAALSSYIGAIEGRPSPDSAGLLRKAVASDPDFGPAWLALANATERLGDRPGAFAVLDEAQKHHLDPVTLASIEAAKANLGTDRAQKLAALRKLSALTPEDTTLIRELAETEGAAGEFKASAADWLRLARVLPTDADPWNQAGYALAWSGDYPGALDAMRQYARARPADVNALDSLGDVHFMYRKFADAVRAYMEASAKNPTFDGGVDFYKTAWAKYYAGDPKGGDTAFDQFVVLQEKAGGNVALAKADWLFRTGRRREGLAFARQSLSSLGNPAEKLVLQTQLAVWEAIDGDRAAAKRDAEALGPPASTGVAIARFVTLPSAGTAEWESRATSFVPSPALEPLRRLCVGYALLLDGKKEAALPVWKQIADSAPPNDFFVRSVYERLSGKEPRLAVLPNPAAVNQFAAVLDKP